VCYIILFTLHSTTGSEKTFTNSYNNLFTRWSEWTLNQVNELESWNCIYHSIIIIIFQICSFECFKIVKLIYFRSQNSKVYLYYIFFKISPLLSNSLRRSVQGTTEILANKKRAMLWDVDHSASILEKIQRKIASHIFIYTNFSHFIIFPHYYFPTLKVKKNL
jgi:hypothetical protein